MIHKTWRIPKYASLYKKFKVLLDLGDETTSLGERSSKLTYIEEIST